MLRVGTNSMIIFTLNCADPDLYDRWETVSLLLVESVTHLETTAA
jgi:hypothetical protein